MLELRAEAYQFFSRSSFPIGPAGTRKTEPRQRPDIVFHLKFEYASKPFEMGFAQLCPQRQSIGAHEYIDADVDAYFSKRWPMCLRALGTFQLPSSEIPNAIRQNVLLFLRKLLWEQPGGAPNPAIPPDQRATVPGYRREFFHSQIFDIQGTRRPSEQSTFFRSDLGEPIGPGLAFVPEFDALNGINEFVWSPILPFPHRTTFDHDKAGIKKALAALRKQYNSYSELTDAQRHLEKHEIKAAVRAAASAVDAYLVHLREAWDGSKPPKKVSFDEKIEHVLRSLKTPSFREVDPDHLRTLLYLYKARNSMHEGDYYYDREDGQRVRVNDPSQVAAFIEAVEAFVLWADSLV